MWNIFFMKDRWEIKIKNIPVFSRNKTHLFIFNLPCIYETSATDSKGNCSIQLKAVLASSDSSLKAMTKGRVVHIHRLWQGPHGALPELTLGHISNVGRVALSKPFHINGYTFLQLPEGFKCWPLIENKHNYVLQLYVLSQFKFDFISNMDFLARAAHFLPDNRSTVPKATESVEDTVHNCEITRSHSILGMLYLLWDAIAWDMALNAESERFGFQSVITIHEHSPRFTLR